MYANTTKRYEFYDRKTTHYVLNALMFEEFSDFERAITNYETAFINSKSDLLLVSKAIDEYYLGNDEAALNIFESIADLPVQLLKYKYYQYILSDIGGKEFVTKELLNDLIQLYASKDSESKMKEGLFLLEKLLKNYKKYKEASYFESFLINALKRKISEVHKEYFSAVLFKYYSKVEKDDSKVKEYVDNFLSNYKDRDYQHLVFIFDELISTKRLELAERVYEILEKARYHDPESYIFNYSLEKAKGNSKKARRIISYAQDQFPGVYFEMFSLQQYLDDKDSTRAAITFNNLILEHPEDFQIYQRYIMSLIENDFIDKAIEMYEITISKFPDMIVLQNNYAYLLIQQKRDVDKAISLALNAVEKEPENISYLDTIAWIYYNRGEYEKAEGYIDKAFALPGVSLDMNSKELYEHYTEIKTKLNKEDEIDEYKTNELTISLHECVTSAMSLLK